MSRKIVILDYGLGNLKSLYNAFSQYDKNIVVTRDINKIKNSHAMIFPGVGSFQPAMNNLSNYDLIDTVNAYLCSGRPVIGICLGLQLLFSKSEEGGSHVGLNFIKGSVKKIPVSGSIYRLPHIGWKKIIRNQQNSDAFSKSIIQTADGQYQYFVHSYVVVPEEESCILASTEYGGHQLVCAVKKDNVTGLQFHPEKSSEQGLKIVKAFVESIKN